MKIMLKNGTASPQSLCSHWVHVIFGYVSEKLRRRLISRHAGETPAGVKPDHTDSVCWNNCLSSLDIPPLVMHRLMNRKMRIIPADSSSTPTITHSHKYCRRVSLTILTKHKCHPTKNGNQTRKDKLRLLFDSCTEDTKKKNQERRRFITSFFVVG